jgi:hypothetical protein
MEDMTYEMENEEVTDLVDCENEETEETGNIDLAKIIKVVGFVAAGAGIAAFANRDKIRKWKEKRDNKKLEKLAAKLGKQVIDEGDVIGCEFEEIETVDESDN